MITVLTSRSTWEAQEGPQAAGEKETVGFSPGSWLRPIPIRTHIPTVFHLAVLFVSFLDILVGCDGGRAWRFRLK